VMRLVQQTGQRWALQWELTSVTKLVGPRVPGLARQ
jgi:hypothetical protein